MWLNRGTLPRLRFRRTLRPWCRLALDLRAAVREQHRPDRQDVPFGNNEPSPRVVGAIVKGNSGGSIVAARFDSVFGFTHLAPRERHPGFVLDDRVELGRRPLVAIVGLIDERDVRPELRLKIAANVQVHRVEIVFGLHLRRKFGRRDVRWRCES